MGFFRGYRPRASGDIVIESDLEPNANGDIHAASMALRHPDFGITAQFYADSRKRVTTGFGHLFNPIHPTSSRLTIDRQRQATKGKVNDLWIAATQDCSFLVLVLNLAISGPNANIAFLINQRSSSEYTQLQTA